MALKEFPSFSVIKIIFFCLGILFCISSQKLHATVDSDGDGMSDVWEKIHSFSQVEDGTDPPNEKPASDYDGDGVSNLQESLAGTNPKSAVSVFKITAFNLAAITGTKTFEFTQAIGKEYQLQSSPDLILWTNLEASFIGTNTPVILTTPASPSNGPKLFYRILVRDIDPDFDTLSSWEEAIICSEPNLADSDSDGVDDNVEYQQGSNPCSGIDQGIPQPFTAAQLPPAKLIKLRLYTGVLLGASYSQISPSATFLTPYDVNVFKKNKITGIETLVYTMAIPAGENSVFRDINLPNLPDFVYTVQADVPDLSSSSLVTPYRDFSFIINLSPIAGGLPFAVAPRFDPTLNPPLGALGPIGFNHGLPYNPHALGIPGYRLVISPVVIQNVISDQIAGNDANQLPTRAYGGQPNNPMVMATRSGVDAKLRVVADPWGPIAPIALVAVREIGTGVIKGSTLALPKPAQTSISFNASNGTKMHEVVSGLDLNANGTLDATEVKNIFEQTPRLMVTGAAYTGKDPTFSQLDKFFVVTQSDFDVARTATRAYGNSIFSFSLPNTAGLISAFADGSSVVTNTSTVFGIPVSTVNIGNPSAKGLSLPLGAKWGPTNEALTHRIIYAQGSDLSKKKRDSAAIREMFSRIINKNKALILAAALPDYTMFKINQISDYANFKIEGFSDVHYAIGKCDFSGSLEISVRSVPGGFEVLLANCIGSFEDLYDFSWPGGIISVPGSFGMITAVDIGNATKTQAGCASLASLPNPDSGRIFYTQVNVSTSNLFFNSIFK